MRQLFGLGILILLFGCQQEPDAQEFIDKAIEVAGGEAYSSFSLEYSFRDKTYLSKRNGGDFAYKRIAIDGTDTIHDTFSNSRPFERLVNGVPAKVADSMADRYSNSINSVNYFVFLPYGLNDEAVNKRYINKVQAMDKSFHLIEVTFDEQGGGKDFEDVYLYWINAETNKIEFLAYSFEVDGGGIRFREAFNERYIGKIRFVDYRNYKPESKEVKLVELLDHFMEGRLELVSTIATENIKMR